MFNEYLLCAEAWAGQSRSPTPALYWGAEWAEGFLWHPACATLRPRLSLTGYSKLVKFVSPVFLPTPTCQGSSLCGRQALLLWLPTWTFFFTFHSLSLSVLSLKLWMGCWKEHRFCPHWGILAAYFTSWVSTFSVNKNNSSACLILWRANEMMNVKLAITIFYRECSTCQALCWMLYVQYPISSFQKP